MNNFRLNNDNKLKSGFINPDGYFNDFSDRIHFKIQKQEPKVVPINSKLNSWLAVAAIAILSLSLPLKQLLSTKTVTKDNIYNVEEYFAENNLISDEILADLLTEESINNLNLDWNISEIELENNLLDYNNLNLIYK